MRKWLRLVAAVVTAVTALAMSGCVGGGNNPKAGVKFQDRKMLHLQQVLERYDATGSAVPQYLELWLTKDAGRCVEMDAKGNELSVALDTGKSHILYDAATKKAMKADKSFVFTVGYDSMKRAYPKTSTSSEGEYAGRPCTLVLMENGSGSDEWVKLYVDRATGYVLLCDAPMFRLRTALIEELPSDSGLFTPPADLSFEGGEGK